MIRYKTVYESGKAEQIIEKSRFIAHVKPVDTKEEADDFIAEIKKKYKNATHNVPAMVIGESQQIQWGSDDGEPQGTSGAPIVQMLVKEGLTNVVVVVTRYFGGIKLGTGGLVRAYTGSAKLGLAAAGLCAVEEMTSCTVEIEYTSLGKIQNLESKSDFRIADTEYTEKVVLEIVFPSEKEVSTVRALEEITGGKMKIKKSEKTLEKNKKST